MVQTFVHSSSPGSTPTEPDFSSYLSKERGVSLRLALCEADCTTYHATSEKKKSTQACQLRCLCATSRVTEGSPNSIPILPSDGDFAPILYLVPSWVNSFHWFRHRTVMKGLNTTLLSSIRSQLALVISFREGKIRLKGERGQKKHRNCSFRQRCMCQSIPARVGHQSSITSMNNRLE